MPAATDKQNDIAKKTALKSLTSFGRRGLRSELDDAIGGKTTTVDFSTLMYLSLKVESSFLSVKLQDALTGNETGLILHSDSAATVQAVIRALPGYENVIVTKFTLVNPPFTEYNFTFKDATPLADPLARLSISAENAGYVTNDATLSVDNVLFPCLATPLSERLVRQMGIVEEALAPSDVLQALLMVPPQTPLGPFDPVMVDGKRWESRGYIGAPNASEPVWRAMLSRRLEDTAGG